MSKLFFIDECGAASFLTFHSDESGTLDKQLNHHLVQATFLNSQTCTVTITTKGTDEMSLEELQTLREMIYYVNSGLIVIEIGKEKGETEISITDGSIEKKNNLQVIKQPKQLLSLSIVLFVGVLLRYILMHQILYFYVMMLKFLKRRY